MNLFNGFKIDFIICRTYFPSGELSPRYGRKPIGLLSIALSFIFNRHVVNKSTSLRYPSHYSGTILNSFLYRKILCRYLTVTHYQFNYNAI